jgi:hypothetical protein
MTHTPRRRRPILLAICLLHAACATTTGARALPENPLGWPARALLQVGEAGESSGLPLVRDGGRLVRAVGDLLEAPALMVEGLVVQPGGRFLEGLDRALVGVGSTVTAAVNLPLFFVSPRAVDIGRDSEAMNEALAFIESSAPETWRCGPEDDREMVLPEGTRTEARGKTLVWTFPGGQRRVQAAQESPLMRWMLPANFIAWERSWGFVVPDEAKFLAQDAKSRVTLILHEFIHQEIQMRRWMRGWTLVYWPAYQITFLGTGWRGHWAETHGPHAANCAGNALKGWRSGE